MKRTAHIHRLPLSFGRRPRQAQRRAEIVAGGALLLLGSWLTAAVIAHGLEAWATGTTCNDTDIILIIASLALMVAGATIIDPDQRPPL